MGRKPVTVDVYLDKSCNKCGEKGACQNGLCISCSAIEAAALWDDIEQPMIAPASIQTMAKTIIEAHHPHLLEAEIVYVLLPGEKFSKGKTVLGRAKKNGEVDALLTEADFVISLPWGTWLKLAHSQRVAVLDHELCHCGAEKDDEGSVTYKLLPHDVEEFSAVIHRHGLYKGDLTEFCQVGAKAVQAALNFEAVEKTGT